MHPLDRRVREEKPCEEERAGNSDETRILWTYVSLPVFCRCVELSQVICMSAISEKDEICVTVVCEKVESLKLRLD